MATHQAVVTVAARAPLQIMSMPTPDPIEGEVKVKALWTASTPLDLHQADGGLLVTPPQILGDGTAGVVTQVGAGVTRLKVGDEVFGFTWREKKEKGQQEYIVAPEFLFGKVPQGFSLQEVITIPNNFVTAWHAATTDLKIPLVWPKPDSVKLPHQEDPILIWGGSSSAGQFMIQLLKFYGYQHIFTTSSRAHHEMLKKLGAAQVFDYREPGVINKIREAAASIKSPSPTIPLFYDPIGSKFGSIEPISQLAQKDSIVATLLPVVVKDATEETAPVYDMEVETSANWAEGVEARGVRTHFYLDSEFAKEHLQPTVMPAMVAAGIITPNRQKVVEGATLLERAQRALDTLRRKEVSGERLVWRINEA